MRPFITGANGMLGFELTRQLDKRSIKYLATDILKDGEFYNFMILDILDEISLSKSIKEFSPAIVLHLAAKTDVDGCETKKEEAFKVNAKATESLAKICKNMNIPMVYISTAAVFKGDKPTPYIETDKPDPLSYYAKTKLEGEIAVKENLKDFYILRAGWMIGGFEKDKKFVAKILKLLETEKWISAVTDKFGSPTFTKDFCFNMIELILGKAPYGLYHMANNGQATRFEMAKKIIEILGLKDIKLSGVTSDAFPLPAPRGRSEMIENSNLNKINMNFMRHWEEALREYIENYKGKLGL